MTRLRRFAAALTAVAALAVAALAGAVGSTAPAIAGPTAAVPSPTDLEPTAAPSPTPAPERDEEPETATAAIQRTVPGAVLVTLGRQAEVDVRDTAAALGGAVTVLGAQSGTLVIRVAVATGREAAAEDRLRGLDGVLAVERDRLRAFATAPAPAPATSQRREQPREPDDAGYSLQWTHDLTGIARAWDTTIGDRDVRVAVLDSGIAADHEDLAANVVEQVDVADGTAEVVTPAGGSPVDGDTCGIGHGTAVAGVLGAVGDDGLGLAGAAWQVSLLDVALVSARGGQRRCDAIPDSAVVAGLDRAVDAGADVVNLSLGGPGDACPRALQVALDEVVDAGVVVVAAAGNAAEERPEVPAACDGVLSIGAVTRGGEVASYSNADPYVDLVAPGGEAGGRGRMVPTTLRPGVACGEPLLDGRWCGVAGTSFSAPYVTGVVALLEVVAPELAPADVGALLALTARREGRGRTDADGWGLVDPAAALERAVSQEPLPAAEATASFPVGVARVAAPGETTDAVRQAVAVSRAVFDPGGAELAVLARRDDFADALGGSALAGAAGPVLFTGREGALARESAEELSRVLRPGAPVYLLGGEAALPLELEAGVIALGYEPRRLAGAAREQTAAAVGEVVAERAGTPDEVLLVTRSGWPDAVAASALAARSELPILLTGTDGLHPATAQLLATWRPETVTVVGGEAVVGEAAADAAAAAADGAALQRLAGPERFGTAAAVARAIAERGDAASVVVVNLRRADAFAHVLSATPLAVARGAVLATVEDDAGTTLPPATRALLAELTGLRAVVAGGGDLVGDGVADEVERVLGG